MVFVETVLFITAFLAESIDIILGMGFGTIMTPLLIEFGHSPLVVLPVVLLLQAIAGLTAGFYHHLRENIDFFKKEKIAISSIFITVGIIGAVGGAFLATHISVFHLKLIIGIVVIFAGITLFIRRFMHKGKHSYPKLFITGILAAFAKTMTGVYGPIVTSGQILSGVDEKEAVATTALTEGITSLFGFLAFTFFVKVNWNLFLLLLIAVLISVPISTYIVKIMHPVHMRRWIGIFVILLGLVLLIRLIPGVA